MRNQWLPRSRGNEAFAGKLNLGDQVVGTRMALGARTNTQLDIEIVGFVRDAKYDEVRDPAPPQFVMPYRQVDTPRSPSTSGPAPTPRRCSERSPRSSARLDANIPISNLRTMEIRSGTTRAAIVH